MLMSVRDMMGVELDVEHFKRNIQRLSNEEIEALIKRLEANTSERRNLEYLTSSIHKHPDRVFYINCSDLVRDGRPLEKTISNLWYARIDPALAKDKQILLLYDDFGRPGTYLAARAGYAVFDPLINRIIAHRWMIIS